jgi:thioredoxin reductase
VSDSGKQSGKGDRLSKLLPIDHQKEQGRKRQAPVAGQLSDVTRFRGIAWAVSSGAVVTLGILVASWGTSAFRAHGPLGRPHRLANLTCASCHQKTDASQACSSCHGKHRSTRKGHRTMAEKGKLQCATCHEIHRHEAGITFLPSGEIIHFSGGTEQRISRNSTPPIHYQPTTPQTVSLVRLEVCSSCHQLSSARDPISRCLPGRKSQSREKISMCLAEHRTVTQARKGAKIVGNIAPDRDAAWHSTQQALVAGVIVPQAKQSKRVPAFSLAMGMLVGLVVMAGVPLVARRKRKKTPKDTKHGSGSTEVKETFSDQLKPPTEKRLPVININTCLGCYACVDVCPYDVLEIENYVAKVVRADDCCGLTLCEQNCPNGSLVIQTEAVVMDNPEVDDSLQSLDVPGLYLAGDVTGLPLIRNAINQGAFALKSMVARAQSAKNSSDKSSVYDVVIVGAGPAGLSAALQAKQRNWRYIVVEQASIAESIRSFPRGKLVFDQPLQLPMVGDLWLKESTKEELLQKWLRVVRSESLVVKEGCRVTKVERSSDQDPWLVRATSLEGEEQCWKAKSVLLAIGRRGTPRKLPVDIPESAQHHVFYSMADARSFEGQKVVIVGLGDVAMESALALSKQPSTQVVMIVRAGEFRRGKARNIQEIQRLIQKGRINIEWDSSVGQVNDRSLVIQSKQTKKTIHYDSLFVLIGSIPPWAFLESLGIRRPKQGLVDVLEKS